MTHTKPSPGKNAQPTSIVSAMLSVTLVVGMIYVAKPVLVPLALAVLVTFIFTPLVTLAQRRTGMGRVPAVALVVVSGLLATAGIGWGVWAQFGKLAANSQEYQTKIESKIQNARAGEKGPIGRIVGSMTSAAETKVQSVGTGPQTQTIVVTQGGKSSFSETAETIGMILEPIGTAGLVLILVIFMLIRREDLRNRVIGLLGHGRLTGTTRVTVEAAHRLSKYLLSQLAVNTAFGTVFAVALAIIGVPYAFLWGFITAVLRFVPYVGTWAAASAPLLLSVAIFDGYGHPLSVFIVFFTLDAVTANLIEPVLFGHSTGVSPVALLIAAAFWTWVWGTVGLVLSTPMTVCLVVLGQHVPNLRWLSLLLGDRPALEPSVSFYQRLLAADRTEAAAVVREQISKTGIDRTFDHVIQPAIRRTRQDRIDSGLTAEDERLIFEATEEIVRGLPAVEASPAKPGPSNSGLVSAVASHHRSEDIAVIMFARLLSGLGLTIETAGNRLLPSEIEALVDRQRPSVIFIAVTPPGGLVQARYLCRRLGKRFADTKIVIGFFGKSRNFDKLLRRLRASGASYVTTSLQQTKAQILALTAGETPGAEPQAEITAIAAPTSV